MLVEKVARGACERHIRRVRRHDTDPATLEEMLPRAVDYAWREHADEARAAIEAVLDAVASELLAVQYDPAPYTAMKVRLAAMRNEALDDG